MRFSASSWFSVALLLVSLAGVRMMPLHAADKELIAVLDLDVEGGTKEQGSAFSARLREELLKTGKYRLIDRSQMEALLKEQALQQIGCTSEECAVKVGQILGVRKIVTGRCIRLSSDVWQVSALMLDVETAETLAAESVVYEGSFVAFVRGGPKELAGKLSGATPPLPLAPAPAPPPSHPAQQQTAVAPPESGSVFRDPITGMEFIFVPGGEYEQGCGHWTSDCDDDETPVRKVHLSPFWIGKTEVTQGQWSRVMGSNPSSQKTGDDYPVETVSWNDVDDFISRLNSRTSEGKFRLPSEAEWEYACRAGGKPIKYAWGNEEPGSASKTGNLYGDSDGHARSAPVGSFAANGIGLFDMTGNVWEWAQDLYRDTAYVDGPTSDPIYAGSGEYRVFRGGGWFSDPRFARCSYRGSGVPTYRADGLGFRLARTKGG